MFHPEALRQPSVFDCGSNQTARLPTPQFLQPVHHPQIHLPPPSPWYQNRQTYPLISPSHGQYWSPAAPNILQNHTQSFGTNYPGTSAHHYESHAPQARLQQIEASTSGPSNSGVPATMCVGQIFDKMPSTPDQHRHEVAGNEVSEEVKSIQSPEGDSRVSSSHKSMASPAPASQPQSKAKEKQSQPESGSGPYIHGLCGRGFSSRSRVKKHHWGYKLDDLETTTGCWAKHGKPNVNWNDHASCREGAKIARQVKRPSRTRSRQEYVQQQARLAPLAPLTKSTTQDLAGADAHMADMRGGYQDTPDMNAYHSHRLPSRSSFDSLLSAVNVASRIDAPQPQEPINSVVSHLDAQAAAAEYNGQCSSDWPSFSTGHSEEAVTWGHHQPYNTGEFETSYPLAGYNAPLEVAPPLFEGRHVHTASMYSPGNGNLSGDHVATLDNTHGSRAPPGLPLSPDPYEGNRKF